MLLVEYARVKGIRMGGMQFHRHIGTTANGELAVDLQRAGMTVIPCYPSPDQYTKFKKSVEQAPLWELSCAVGAEVIKAA